MSEITASQLVVQEIVTEAERQGLKLDSQEHLPAIRRMINAAMAQITSQSLHSFQVWVEGPTDNPQAQSFEIYLQQHARKRTNEVLIGQVKVNSVRSIKELVERVTGKIQEKSRSLAQQY